MLKKFISGLAVVFIFFTQGIYGDDAFKLTNTIGYIAGEAFSIGFNKKFDSDMKLKKYNNAEVEAIEEFRDEVKSALVDPLKIKIQVYVQNNYTADEIKTINEYYSQPVIQRALLCMAIDSNRDACLAKMPKAQRENMEKFYSTEVGIKSLLLFLEMNKNLESIIRSEEFNIKLAGIITNMMQKNIKADMK
jgi:hypothetical protein